LSRTTATLGPSGNATGLRGSVTSTDLSVVGALAWAASVPSAAVEIRASARDLRVMVLSSRHRHGRRFDDVAHEAGRVPVGRRRLDLAFAVGAADHEHERALGLRREARLPAAEAVF